MRSVCSAIQIHQSLRFCSLEHIPQILLGFVPHNLPNSDTVESCRAERVRLI